MIPSPDAGFVYPKTGLNVDLRLDTAPRFVSTGSAFFDDTDDFVNCGDHANSQMTTGNFSVVYWAKTTGTAEHFCVSKQDGASTYDGYRFGFKGDGVTRCSIQVDGSNKTGDVDGTAVVNDGVWHHFAFTIDRSSNLLCYVDGQLDKTTDISSISGSIDPDEDLILGASYSGANQNFGGCLCNVGIYKGTVLTQAQVRSIMLATSYTATAAVVTPSLYYLLDDDYNDSTGNQNGTNNGSVLVGDCARLPNGFDLTGTRLDADVVSGRAFDFDGTGDGLRGTTTFDINGSGDTTTLSCWFNADSLSGGNTTIVGNTKANVSNNLAIYRTGTNEIAAIAYYAASTHVKVSTGSVLQAGKWYHVATTFDKDSTTIKLYVDGKEYSAAPSLAYGGTDNTFEIGYRYNSGSPLQAFSGKIAHVKMFDIAFTAAQALEQYKNPEQILPTGASASNLKRWYPLSDFDIGGANNLNGLFAQDCSGNDKHLIADNCGMSFAEPTPCPQLGLQSSSSLIYLAGASSGDYLQSSDTSLSTATFTFSAWVCAFDSAGNYPSIISAHDGSSNDYQNGITIDFGSSSQTAVEYINIEGVGVSSATDLWSGSIAFGQWFHIVVTSTTSEYKLYINGSDTNCNTRSRSDTSANDLNIVRIGARYYSSGLQAATQFDGLITDVGLWNAALDADSVAAIHSAGKGADIRSDIGNYDQSSALQHLWRTDNPVTCSDLEGSDDMTVYGAPNMATAPEGTTAGLSTFGAITTKTVGSSKINFPFMQNVNSTQLQGYLKHDCPTWGTGEYCVAFWLRTTHLSGGSTHYFWDIRGSTNSYGMRIYASATNNILWKPKGAGSGEVAIYPAPASGTVTDGAWHFVALQRLGATSQKWHWRRITDASFNTGTNSTGFGDMTDAGTAYINGSASATSPSGGQIAMPRLYIGKSFSDNEIGNMFEQGKRILLGDTL